MTNHAELGDWLDERQERFISMAHDIWMRPELALAETYACGRQADDLAADGFTITRNVGDLPTAFTAEWGSGAPVIGFLGEYDALPNLSQRAESGQAQALAGGAGHGCGHNLLGTASLAAASALKAWLEETGQPGTVRYYGCPAEEIGAGKVFMARAGAFDGLDAAITWHPGEKNTVWGSSSLAIDHIKFRFHGQTAHAAGNPELGRSSLDAVELTNVGVNFMREHIIEQARIHYVITNGGGAPNIVPDDAEVWYFIRAPHRAQVEELTAWVRKIARGAAMMTKRASKSTRSTACITICRTAPSPMSPVTCWKSLGRSISPPRNVSSPRRWSLGTPKPPALGRCVRSTCLRRLLVSRFSDAAGEPRLRGAVR